jgi:1A family penicillin-binding protein
MEHFFHRLHQHLQKITKLSRKRKIFLAIWTGLSALVVIAIFTTLYYATTLSSKDRIMNRNNTGVTLLDRNGKPFYQFYNAHSSNSVPLSQIAPVAQKALISSEDKNFYKESGFSIRGILGAAVNDVKSGGIAGGGSTISQQLVKNSLLTQNQTFLRKYQELVLSVELSQKYSKNEILEMYLNSVYFGEGAFGIQDAAKTYFNTTAQNLTLAQASMLIGVVPAPSAYSPISGSATLAKQRQTYVLRRMQEDGVITKDQQQAALGEQLAYSAQTEQDELKAPHFALMVKDALVKKYGEEKVARSGDKVTTTLDLDTQAKAESAVTTQVNSLARSHVTNGSAVVEDPKTGEIRALVGSVDWNNTSFGKVNMATSTRQPGSSFKPIVYSTGIEQKDFSAASILHDKATDFGGGYSPKDFDLRYRGDVTVRRSIANSLNIPAVEALQETGVGNTIDMAKKLGLTTLTDSPEHYGLPLALGSAQARLTEMTNAYATFADQGQYKDLQTILSIKDKNNKVVYKEKTKPKQVISADTSYIMSSMMSDNTARAEEFGSSLTVANDRPAAVKTGTTEDYRDAWTIGYTPSLAIGVWIGNNDNSQMSAVAGSSGAAPIWRKLMQELLAGTTVEKFPQPSGLVSATVCRANGAVAGQSGSNTLTEYFLPDTLPTTKCNEKQETPTQQTPAPTPTTPTQTPDDNKPAKTATYTGQVLTSIPTDQSTLHVSIRVQNTGEASGTPTCTITADSPDHTYHGSATVQPTTALAAGETWNGSQDVPINNQGALHATNVTVSCQ